MEKENLWHTLFVGEGHVWGLMRPGDENRKKGTSDGKQEEREEKEWESTRQKESRETGDSYGFSVLPKRVWVSEKGYPRNESSDQ